MVILLVQLNPAVNMRVSFFLSELSVFSVVILQFVTLKLNERRMILWKTEL